MSHVWESNACISRQSLAWRSVIPPVRLSHSAFCSICSIWWPQLLRSIHAPAESAFTLQSCFVLKPFLWLYHLTSTKQACILSGRKGEPFMHFLNPLILQISHSHCLCVCFGLGVICLLLLLLLLLCSCIFCSAKKTRFELESWVKLATIENSYLDMERTVGELTRRSKAR